MIDVSNPGNCVKVGEIGLCWAEYGDVAVAGNFACVANAHCCLRVIDVSNPTNLVEVSSLGCGRLVSAVGVAVSGNYAYVAANEEVRPGFGKFNIGHLLVYDITNPSNPAFMGRCTVGAFLTLRSVEVSGNHAYVADRLKGLHVIEISVFGGSPIGVLDGLALDRKASWRLPGMPQASNLEA